MINIENSKSVEDNLKNILTQSLVVDLETSSFYPNGKEINIHTNFEDYIAHAKIKWLGFFSYKTNKSYIFNHNDDLKEAYKLIQSHKILIGHNIEDFDLPILINNGFIKEPKDYMIIDTMIILGKVSFHTKKGFPFKNRGELMDYDFPSNSLRSIAEVMKLETQKGEIDYRIFQKNTWVPDETKQIITYLNSDVLACKQMFDKLWGFWLPFTKFLPLKSIYDLSWIRGSIASVIYKSACNILGVEPTYADKIDKPKESMGGNVIEPQLEEARSVWYVDFTSLYPHIMASFNIFAEVDSSVGGKYIWHGNDLFKVKGYYDVSRPHPLSKIVIEFLKTRIELKKNDPKNPLVYTYKIFLNGLYGVIRSAIFEQVHQPNAGWDICWLGQQFQKLLIDMMTEFGFICIAGDTDSGFFITKDKNKDNETYVKECLQKVINRIQSNVPLPVDTFGITLEHHIDYITWAFEFAPLVDDETRKLLTKAQKENKPLIGYEEKVDGKKKNLIRNSDNKIVKAGRSWVEERRGVKKNYIYLWTNKDGKKEIEIKGLPLIKNNATALGIEIYEKILKTRILEKGNCKFPQEEIDAMINSYLQQPNAMELISQEYKVKPAKSYKKESQIQAQISKAYFNGADGVIRLIKNNICGKAGKGKVRYCSIPEALQNKLTMTNLELTKVQNELNPFVLFTPIGAKNES